jgi:1-acyl-sn-glycerol-3-phosphate acyltransferase
VRALNNAIFKLLGWQCVDMRSAPVLSYIIVVAPHTSNWDFLVGLAARSILRLGDVKYLAKKELFRGPAGWFFRAVGGFPVDRSRHTNLVDAVVDLFGNDPNFKICVTPEGTRRYQPDWKTGFWHMARGARVPLLLCAFDYARKEVRLSEPFWPGDDLATDIERMKAYFRTATGRNPADGVR